MPKQNVKSLPTTKTSVQSERPPFVGYVNVTLTNDDKADFDAWSSDSEIVEDAYLSALELGYQYSNKFDKATECFICTVSNWDASRPDAGLLYTARANHPFKAFQKAVYVSTRKFAFNLANGYVMRANRDAF